MSEERCVVTHTTESGATRMWWVDEATAKDAINAMATGDFSKQQKSMLKMATTTGRALIWLTPGQSLTVERSNG